MKPYYERDGVTIYHGDCRETDAWTAADVLVTDPPYGMNHRSGWSERPIIGDGDTGARDAALRMWGGKPALVFGHWNHPPPAGARMCLTWDKGDWPGMGDLTLPWGPSTENVYVIGYGFNGRRTGSTIRVNRLTGSMPHPTEKPEALLVSLIARCPTGCIADPFAGIGTTLVAAHRLGRRAIGVEIEERYCEIAAKRLAQGTLLSAAT